MGYSDIISLVLSITVGLLCTPLYCMDLSMLAIYTFKRCAVSPFKTLTKFPYDLIPSYPGKFFQLV